jgi:hypothetical protein
MEGMAESGGGVQGIVLGLNAVIVAVTKRNPRILTITGSTIDRSGATSRGVGPGLDVLPHGPLDPKADRTLELTLRGWVRERTGLELGYVEQLYTFGDRDRGGGGVPASPRMISLAYLALVREELPSGTAEARWRDLYSYFPWEDWRSGRPALLESVIDSKVRRWIMSAPRGPLREERRDRAGIAFGLEGVGWDGDRVLERYELLYEMGLVAEAQRRVGNAPGNNTPEMGRPMDMDHRRILATGLGRIRGKLRYRPVVFELLPDSFTLLLLQQVVEALAGVPLHKQNFRRLVGHGGLVEGTGAFDAETGGRPAELFRFRREVLRERRAPGLLR